MGWEGQMRSGPLQVFPDNRDPSKGPDPGPGLPNGHWMGALLSRPQFPFCDMSVRLDAGGGSWLQQATCLSLPTPICLVRGDVRRQRDILHCPLGAAPAIPPQFRKGSAPKVPQGARWRKTLER